METRQRQLMTNVALSATAFTPWTRTAGASTGYHISWAGAGTPVGAWTVEISNDPLIRAEQDNFTASSASAAKKVDITANISPIQGTGFAVSGGTDGSTYFALTAGVPTFVRLKYTRTSGGSASSLANVWVEEKE